MPISNTPPNENFPEIEEGLADLPPPCPLFVGFIDVPEAAEQDFGPVTLEINAGNEGEMAANGADGHTQPGWGGVVDRSLSAQLAAYAIAREKVCNRLVRTVTRGERHRARSASAPPLPSFRLSSLQPNNAPLSSIQNMGVSSLSEARFVLAVGLLLSLNSGYLNGLCLSGLLTEEGSYKESVAVTGAYTTSSLALAGGIYKDFAFSFSLILVFIGGAFVSGLMNPHAIPHMIHPSYGVTFSLGSLCLIAASIVVDIEPNGRLHYFLAAAANGMQNGMSSMYTANLMRTASHGGTSTDIGLIIGQMLRGIWKNYWKFQVLVGLASSYWFGSLISFYSVTEFSHYSFKFSAALFMVISVSHLTFVVLTQKVSFFQASFGTWKWDAVLERVASSLTDYTGSTTLRSMTIEQVDHLFDLFDSDGSGKIDAVELKSALEKIGNRITRADVLAMMTVADENGDGEVDREEFHNLIITAALKSIKKSERREEHSCHPRRQVI